MTRAEIEQRLKLHLFNLCLASLPGMEAGTLTQCKSNLLDEVEAIVRDAKAKP